jgi:dTMP kinase
MMNNAKFIVIEGLEGAGKSTAMKAVIDTLTDCGVHSIVTTREPGGTPLAEKMRELVKHDYQDEVLHDMTELLLMYAARVQLVENVIKPALANGSWVVGDRHDLSSQAYQGGGRGIASDTMQSLKQVTLGSFEPDLTLYLDIDPKIGLARARGRGELDRIEKMDVSFFQRTRERYLQLALNNSRIITINAEQSVAEVKHDIAEVISDWIHCSAPTLG